MYKIVLFYKFVPLNDPAMTMLWQRELCRRLNLKGRIIVSRQGINGTLGGSLDNLRNYKKEMNKSDIFRGIQYKWSLGGGYEFPRLSVKVRPELVAFDVPDEVEVDEKGVRGGGNRIKPKALHNLLQERGKEVVLFDGRNKYEADIGRFENAVVPATATTRDFIKELDSGKFDDIKDKTVVTYCTGGIRCEILSMLMKKRGFKDVYQLDGGIVKYGEQYGDNGFWKGNLYVFDQRINQKFSKKAKDIGRCVHCQSLTSNYENCLDPSCNQLVLICGSCRGSRSHCSKHAKQKT